jgi:glucosamine-6-phosphate deaminase
MKIAIVEDKIQVGIKAAQKGIEFLKQAIQTKGFAHIIVATGVSQFEMLNELIKAEIDWSKVTGFHLDEYIGIDENHPASFRKYLKERLVDKVNLKDFHYLNGEIDPKTECRRVGKIIDENQIDVAFVGIGENGHLAFNDPPADFEIETPYLVVNLDEKCRLQQLGEGWFETLESVPKNAISMSVRHIMKSNAIICTVPDERKAEAVRNTVEGAVSPYVPASILREHSNVWLFLDKPAASLLKEM